MSQSKIYLHTEQNHQLRDPNIIIPLIYIALKLKRVLDIGCGTGTFINVFKKIGIEKVIGVAVLGQGGVCKTRFCFA